ncbi:MAG: hypothetical protein GF364_09020 [Candidatus Lokiarchaeota archaeon]|nr:hypothetical protein [Candidatus Lokiarchaeota archaeon]
MKLDDRDSHNYDEYIGILNDMKGHRRLDPYIPRNDGDSSIIECVIALIMLGIAIIVIILT